jgi:membrane protein implicated in regulation of membrane protease activity
VSFLEQPAVVLALVFAASALIAVSLGLGRPVAARAVAVVLLGLAAVGIGGGDTEWWPLVGVPVAVGIWASMIATSKSPFSRRAVAGLVYAVSAITFGTVNGDAVALVVADLSSVILPFAFPWVMSTAAVRLALPPREGLEKLIGKLGTVTLWSGSSGVVRVEGGLWNATGMKQASMLDKVLVTDVRGVSLVVVPTAPRLEQLDLDDDTPG